MMFPPPPSPLTRDAMNSIVDLSSRINLLSLLPTTNNNYASGCSSDGNSSESTYSTNSTLCDDKSKFDACKSFNLSYSNRPCNLMVNTPLNNSVWIPQNDDLKLLGRRLSKTNGVNRTSTHCNKSHTSHIQEQFSLKKNLPANNIRETLGNHQLVNRPPARLSDTDPRLNLVMQAGDVKSIRFKTTICIHWARDGHCHKRQECRFAHGLIELRQAEQHPCFRTQYCMHFQRSGGKFCPYGEKCYFIHRM